MMLREMAWGKLLRQTFSEWSADKVPQLGAALAFYTALSIAPLLVLLLRVIAFFFGEEAARGEIDHQTQALIGSSGAGAIQAVIKNAHEASSGFTATLISLLTLAFGATAVFGQLQDSLNTIWGAPPRSDLGLVGMLLARLLSLVMVLGVLFLLLVSLVLSAALAFVGSYLDSLPGIDKVLNQVLNLSVSFAVLTLLFALMFKLLPNVRVAWRDVWLGAVVTALLFTLGKSAIGFYLGRSTLASSYGAAGSFVLLLVWIYYSAQILFLGAELTQVYANHFGSQKKGC